MSDSESFKVVIVGGGIAGLTCGVYLQRAGIDVNLYEAASKFGEIGAGVDFGNNAIRSLKDLDLLDDVLQNISETLVQTSFVFASGEDVSQTIYNYDATEKEVGLTLYRPDYLDALIAAFDHAKAHFNKRCAKVVEGDDDSPCKIEFEDGSSVDADVVLGCDGIQSSVRASIDPPRESEKQGVRDRDVNAEGKHLIFTKTVAYRGLVDVSKLESNDIKLEMKKRAIYCGSGRHIVTYPIEKGKVMNIAAFVQDKEEVNDQREESSHKWVQKVAQEELSRQFQSFDEPLRKMLSLIEEPQRWSIYATDPLSSFVKGRVALLGDAAHAMLPHMGAGAGQAIEDARLICKLLVHPSCTRSALPAILEAYSALRQPRANEVARASRAAGDKYDGFGPGGAEGRKDDLKDQWSFVWRHDLAMDEQAAISHFQDAINIDN